MGNWGNGDDGGKYFSSLKHQNSYLNCHLCPGPKVFIQNDNKKDTLTHRKSHSQRAALSQASGVTKLKRT